MKKFLVIIICLCTVAAFAHGSCPDSSKRQNRVPSGTKNNLYKMT